MSLSDLSADYEHSAMLLRARLAELRSELRGTEDPEHVYKLKRRIADLVPILTQMNELSELTARYYERGYYRNEKYTSNCFGARPRGVKAAKGDLVEHNATGVDGAPAGYVHAVLPGRSDDPADRKEQRREQKYRESYAGESRVQDTSNHEVSVDVLNKFFK